MPLVMVLLDDSTMYLIPSEDVFVKILKKDCQYMTATTQTAVLTALFCDCG